MPGPFPPVPLTPSLSSYVEAVGSLQSVATNGDVIFDVSEATLDVVGVDIELDATGTVFTIKRPGLYHVEWSVNLEQGDQPILIGLMENGEPSSALSNVASSGNYASGALINVTRNDVPYTVSLHNFGMAVSLHNPTAIENTAASIRILRFADGPSF